MSKFDHYSDNIDAHIDVALGGHWSKIPQIPAPINYNDYVPNPYVKLVQEFGLLDELLIELKEDNIRKEKMRADGWSIGVSYTPLDVMCNILRERVFWESING